MNREVSFPIAKLLKEKGYPQLNKGLYYTKDKEHCLVGWGFNDRTENSFAQYSAPPIAEVVMWLYDKHGVWISVQPNTPYVDNDWCFAIFKDLKENISLEGYDSPVEAYEVAIKHTLNNLL